jgi:hypothetical protein
MSQSKQQTVWVVLAVMVLIAACSEVPQSDVDAAEGSLNEAVAASDGVYATGEVAEAQAAVEAMEAEIAAQQEKFALFRSYADTRELAAAAQQAAVDAGNAVEAAKLEAEAEANAALEGLSASDASAAGLLTELGACPRKPKGFAADLETLSGTLAGFAEQRSEVESLIADGDYRGASELAASVQEQIDGLIAEMDEAKAKIGC